MGKNKVPKRIQADEAHAQSVFKSACDYIWTIKQLRTQTPRDLIVRVSFPTLVLESFAIELLLKSIAALSNGLYLATHDLGELYKEVPPSIQARIEDLWRGLRIPDFLNEVAAAIGSGRRVNNLYEFLQQGARSFEQLRYRHQGNLSSANFMNTETYEAICGAILELRPNWIEMTYLEQLPA
ncbi:hypothetical protein GOC45_03875 [Sinorhizobium meliloti]|nr:hypothetical protein [Sinorhizobium meliloti]